MKSASSTFHASPLFRMSRFVCASSVRVTGCFAEALEECWKIPSQSIRTNTPLHWMGLASLITMHKNCLLCFMCVCVCCWPMVYLILCRIHFSVNYYYRHRHPPHYPYIWFCEYFKYAHWIRYQVVINSRQQHQQQQQYESWNFKRYNRKIEGKLLVN